MIDFIANRLQLEMFIAGLIASGLLFVFSLKRPEVCFTLGFPSLLFLGQLKVVFPVSVSAGAAIFPLCAILGTLVRRKIFFLGRCEKLMVAMGLFVALSVTYSKSPIYGLEKSILFNFMALPVIIFAPIVIRDIRSLYSVFSIFSISLIIFVITSALLIGQSVNGEGREAALLSITVASQFLGIAIIFLFFNIVLGRQDFHRKFINGSLIVISIFLLLRTGSRTAFLGIILTFSFMLWFIYPILLNMMNKQRKKVYGLIFFCLFILISAPPIFRALIPENILSRFSNPQVLFSNFTAQELKYWESSRGRALNFNCAVRSFLAHPLLGLGSGGYKDTLRNYVPKHSASLKEGAPAYPHNMILEFASEQGVIGLFLILSVLYLNWKMILDLKTTVNLNPHHALVISCCVGLYVFGFLVSMGSLDIPRMMALWWGMGLLLAANNIFKFELRPQKLIKSTTVQVKHAKSFCHYPDLQP